MGEDSGRGRSSSHEPARFQGRVAQRRHGRHRLRFLEIQRGEPLLLPMEVHGVAATPKVIDAHGGRSQDPADP